MGVTEQELTRLAFIRELYRRAAEGSTEPEPLAAMAILGFHDAVELFLHVSATHLNAELTTRTDFAGYFDRIDAKLPNGSVLHGRPSMLQLNQARVGLKHQGIMPAHASIEGHRAATTSFLEVNTPLVFEGTQLSALDVAQLVIFPETRSHLEASAAALDAGDITTALMEAAFAFAILQGEFRDRSGLRGFGGWASVSAPSVADDDVERALGDLASEVEQELERLEGMVEFISLGIDMLRWQRFALWTPRVYKGNDGWRTNMAWTGAERRGFDASHVDYCRDFVIDSALRLQRAG